MTASAAALKFFFMWFPRSLKSRCCQCRVAKVALLTACRRRGSAQISNEKPLTRWGNNLPKIGAALALAHLH